MQGQIFEAANIWVSGITSALTEVSDPHDLPAAYPIGQWFTVKETGETLALDSQLPTGFYTVDIETCKIGPDNWVPFCAVIYVFATRVYWYLQCRAIEPFLELPIASGSILVGQNITGYDRQYFQNEYSLDPPFEYLDTMCLAIRLRGISNQQEALYALHRGDSSCHQWTDEHHTNGLQGLCEAYLGVQVDKGTRTKIIGKPWAFYKENAHEILDYCAKDVFYTSELARVLWTECLGEFHPVSLRAMGLLSKSRIPLDAEDLKAYIRKLDSYYDSRMQEVSEVLDALMAKAFETIVKPWMAGDLRIPDMPVGYQHLDWEPAKTGATKGQPLWYRKRPKAGTLTLSGHLAPVLLGTRYSGHPVYWSQGSWCADGQQIPHPQGQGNLGQVFNKHFFPALGSLITIDDETAYPAVREIKDLQFWKAFQSRIKNVQRFTRNGVHIPDYKPWGTVSGRGVDSLWLVSPKPEKDKPGSELRALVKTPEDWRIIGADYASQEMRIFALMGDSLRGRLGSSELSKLILSNGDLHTALSDLTNAPRKLCKNVNYGAVYGLGLTTAEVYCRLAGMENPAQVAKTILAGLKGQKMPNGFFAGGLASLSFNAVIGLLRDPEGAKSPILANRISKALRTSEFVPSRQNWYVQVSGSDLRDLLVCAMDYLVPEVSLMLYVHDEPRYLVPLALSTRVAECLQTAHQFSIETMAEEFSLQGLPDFFLHFDCVEVDTIWRKSADDSCVTPTQPVPVPPGIELKYA